MFKGIITGLGLAKELISLISKKKSNKKIDLDQYKHFKKKLEGVKFDFNKDGVQDIKDITFLIDQLSKEQML